jgi:hypothetical protein
MEARIEKLEEFAIDVRERLMKIETRLDQTATKADLEGLRSEVHKGFADTIRWVIGTAVIMAAAAITIMTFVLNHAVPPRNAPQQLVSPAPVIFQLPPYPTSAPTR